MKTIYLDNAATTPLMPEVREAMLPFLDGDFGNPSSLHQWGDPAREAVENARGKVADLIGANGEEIIFTGSTCSRPRPSARSSPAVAPRAITLQSRDWLSPVRIRANT